MDFGRSKKKVVPRGLTPAVVNRLRVRWGRSVEGSNSSHLDNIRAIEEAIKRSGIPASYTKGVHPRLKLSFSPPLPVGFTSESEFVDITIEQPASTEMINKIRQEFPGGMELLEAKTVFSKSGSLSEQINRVEYKLDLADSLDKAELQNKISEVLTKDEIEWMRKTKSGVVEVDLRPAIYDLVIKENVLWLILGVGNGGYARPTEIAQLLFDVDEDEAGTFKFHRVRMYRRAEDGQEIPAIEL